MPVTASPCSSVRAGSQFRKRGDYVLAHHPIRSARHGHSFSLRATPSDVGRGTQLAMMDLTLTAGSGSRRRVAPVDPRDTVGPGED